MNLLCAICSDLFLPSDDVHSTTCGHMFHYACLLQWLQRSPTCPQCRNRCTESKLVKVYFNVAASATAEDGAQLLVKLDNLTLRLHESEKSLKDFQKKNADHKEEQKKVRKILLGLEDQLRAKETALFAYKHEIDMLRGDRKLMVKMQEELDTLRPKLEAYATIKQALTSTVQEVEQMLTSDTRRETVIALAAALKRELQAQEMKRKEQSDRIHRLQNELSEERRKRKALEENISTYESELYRLNQLLPNAVKDSKNVSSDSISPDGSIILNTPDQVAPVRRKRPLAEDLNSSTPLTEKVRKILTSTSPYLRIKTSNVGLAPLMRAGLSAKPLAKSDPSDTARAPLGKQGSGTVAGSSGTSGTSKFSIFANQRPSHSITKPASLRDPLTGLERAGTSSHRKENLEEEPEPERSEPPRFKLTSTTVTARLKAGKLKRHPSTTVASGGTALEGITDLDLEDIVNV
ncbi:E3 ubiquitin-protein ligase TRAIP-like [Anopheles aquasalis]|uniref:E3 ubiquitin-protein ligase TRAIP-like n=1 Tax=Anopheles aquasalis TaxID=42839 RepID=UPI00215B318A|nr:E3 ubiquitin-protein ligase TRAIP-like [Anopheles aquasalis]